MNNCPHCNEPDCFRDIAPVVYRNVECYGNQAFNIPCIHCKKMIRVYLERKVIVSDIIKSAALEFESDFS